ncbi:MAG: hypothetical protein ACE5IF_04260 [Candidatus Bathyarchaeia archaeon]
MKYVTRALLACGLLLYAASVVLPWFQRGLIGGATIYYWSFKAEIHPYPSFRPPYEVMFFDYWSLYGVGTILFVSQILTFLFGLLTLLRGVERRYGLIFLGLTLLFSAVPILQVFELWRIRFITSFEIGFWVASFAFLLLIASLLTSLIK